MRYFLDNEFVERLIFSVIFIGILLAGIAVVRYADLASKLSTNQATQIHDSGGEVTIENKSQAQGLMAADIARRRLLADQSNMMMVGGAGLALVGLGWLARDLVRGRRRRKAEQENAKANIISS